MKSTPTRGVKEILKPGAYEQSEDLWSLFGVMGLTAYLLYNGSTSWSYERA